MKTKLQFAIIIASFFAFQMSGQNRTTLSTMNSDISDNLDLTAVSSIFGESRDLNDFERRLNDPKYQISNLDLNNDNQVDYLRVIESVEDNIHVVVIQSILGRDLYQDVATIEIEKDRQSKISIQIVGNSFIYGQNYIYEPVYYSTPVIYANFWTSYYRPYYSTWRWNSYPTFYVAWNPRPIYLYRQNIYRSVNYHNTYNYVNYRKCYRAPAIYSSYSYNSYERKYPNNSFSRRNSNYTNRYELNQKRYTNNSTNKGKVAYSNSRREISSNQHQREYSQNRTNYSRANSTNDYKQNNAQNRSNSSRTINQTTTAPKREYQQKISKDNNNQRVYSQNRKSTSRENNTQRSQPQNVNSQSRTNSVRENNTQRSQPQNSNSQSRTNSGRENNSIRT